MKLISRHALLFCALTLLGLNVQAQELKVGIVNLDRILREANTSKAAQAKLEQEFGKREKEVNDLGVQLKTLADKFEREAPTLSESQRNLRQKQLVDQDRDLQRKQQQFHEDLNNRKNEEMQLVYERTNKIVKSIAEAEKYDLIVQEAVYVNPKHDITDKVIKSLNATGAR